MTINEFPKEHLETILSQYYRIANMKPEEAVFVSSDNIPSHLQLITIFDITGFFEAFDYIAWTETQGWDKVISPDTLATADFDTLRKLISTHIRTDRFVGGHWDKLLTSGYIAKFLGRLQDLYNEAYPQS
ncbi:hypothetical protein HB364_29285 [Pseudoflavitalea sp. X16]|uniref:DUF6508 domain-containing protein n=1 Tax=Paraflavitalea devenefica TaxID=2716334 RepID=UPI00141F2199|nr:DUF6508 domain-containing protein [Paraflavitalea devenefica]NII29209.1 hypothetical protein [Paraflavitalea devenefica]